MTFDARKEAEHVALAYFKTPLPGWADYLNDLTAALQRAFEAGQRAAHPALPVRLPLVGDRWFYGGGGVMSPRTVVLATAPCEDTDGHWAAEDGGWFDVAAFTDGTLKFVAAASPAPQVQETPPIGAAGGSDTRPENAATETSPKPTSGSGESGRRDTRERPGLVTETSGALLDVLETIRARMVALLERAKQWRAESDEHGKDYASGYCGGVSASAELFDDSVARITASHQQGSTGSAGGEGAEKLGTPSVPATVPLSAASEGEQLALTEVRRLNKRLDFMGLQLDRAWGNVNKADFEARAKPCLDDPAMSLETPDDMLAAAPPPPEVPADLPWPPEAGDVWSDGYDEWTFLGTSRIGKHTGKTYWDSLLVGDGNEGMGWREEDAASGRLKFVRRGSPKRSVDP